MVFLYAFGAGAGEALDAVNYEVANRATQMDQAHGILLDTQEREALKLKLIAKRLNEQHPDKSVQEKIIKAETEYDITGTSEQRQLLIEIEDSLIGGGWKPPCCPN